MKKIFWVDLEMTGLDPYEAVIIEFAGIVTDLELREIADYQAVVFQPPEELNKMNEWNVTTHGASGLLDLIPNGKPLAQVEQEIISFIANQFGDEKPVIAGNSIHQDRKFIDRYMKDLADHLHYRMIDVSAFKQVFKHLYGVDVVKKNPHRALDDIKSSISELKEYLGYINIPQD